VKDLAGRRLKWSQSWSSKPGTCPSSQSDSWIRRSTSLYTSSFCRWWRGWCACKDCIALLPQLSMSCSITMSARDQHHHNYEREWIVKKWRRSKSEREEKTRRSERGERGKMMEIQLTENSFLSLFVFFLIFCLFVWLCSLSRY